MDYPDAKDWYVVGICQLPGSNDRFTMNGYITTGIPLDGYRQAARKDKFKALEGIVFLRTWCKDKGKGVATTISPAHLKGKEKYW